MDELPKDKPTDAGTVAVTLPGKVQKIIPPIHPGDAEKAEISVETAEPLYKEIRVENVFRDETGKEVALKPGAEVDVTLEADREDTISKEHPRKAS